MAWSGRGHPGLPLLRGRRGAISAAHPLAVAAGQELFARGGSAVDAAIAAQAALCVVLPQACGIGGDGLALVAQDGVCTAVTGTGAAPAAGVPGAHDDAGGSVTVPGVVRGWADLHAAGGRSDLASVLAPAVALAEAAPADRSVVAAAAAQRGRLLRGGAAGWEVLQARPGGTLRQPALSRVLRAIAADGPDAFYQGWVAEVVAAAARRDGGTLEADDLHAHVSLVGPPVAVTWENGSVAVQPPPSQGVLLAMALRWLEAEGVPEDPDVRRHVLVELTAAVFASRDRVAADRAALLEQPLAVDRLSASRHGGPRGYLHTAAVAAADSDGTVVSSLVSVFDDFGSATFVPEGGFVLNNRAGGFTAPPNDPGPGKRPVHTLAPVLVLTPDATFGLATPGADGQVQTLLQVLTEGRDVVAAVAAPRWRSEGGRLLVERSASWAEPLAARGHDVVTVDDGDEAFGAVAGAGLRDGWPVAVADWRRTTWAGVA